MIACLMLAVFAIADVICRLSDRRAVKWVAHIYWEGTHYRHTARCEADALDWVRQYPRGSAGLVERDLRGSFTITHKRVA